MTTKRFNVGCHGFATSLGALVVLVRIDQMAIHVIL